MKARLAFALALGVALVPGWCAGQNLVPNGSFEEYTECPDSPGQCDRSTGWLKFRWTPDYFNACNANDYCDVPMNAFGYQYASEGYAYSGLLTYLESDPNVREYIGIELLEPLIPGVPVHLSFKAAPGGWSWYPVGFRYTTEGIGMYFTMDPWYGTEGTIPNTAALHLTTALTDTLDWTVVSGTYIPDSAYRYVVLGNFFVDSLVHPVEQDPQSNYPGAYAFLDEICVSPQGTECLASGIPEGMLGLPLVYPNPFEDDLWIRVPAACPRLISIAVSDVFGRIVYRQSSLVSGQEHYRISVPFIDGHYSVALLDEQGALYITHIVRLSSN